MNLVDLNFILENTNGLQINGSLAGGLQDRKGGNIQWQSYSNVAEPSLIALRKAPSQEYCPGLNRVVTSMVTDTK